MINVLDRIDSPSDLKKLSMDELNLLADDVRYAMLNRLSKFGGHFGPNLGVVEITIALHYVFDSPVDRIVYDVSHQCYPHKILTGRSKGFLDEDWFKKISGYTNPDESEHDVFKIGHTSTSISLATGLCVGRDLLGEKHNIIAVIGDGSLSGGEAMEGLDFAGEYDKNLIIVVNDNDMSIAENHGGIYENLKKLRNSDGKAEDNWFKGFSLDYRYVDDGHDIAKLVEAFKSVKDIDHPVVVHVKTTKGKGYALAEDHKEQWHYCAPFDLETGKAYSVDSSESYTSLTRAYLTDKLDSDDSVCVITSATPTLMGFDRDLRDRYKGRFIDVGIAEEDAVAMASGIAKAGAKPVYGVYATFLQRTYDQILQDVCINKSPVTVLVFSGSIYGMKDITHIGYYDVAMLSHIPGLVYLAPSYYEEYAAMADWAIAQKDYPVFIRVPGGKVLHSDEAFETDYSELNKAKVYKRGSEVALVGVGPFVEIAMSVSEELKKSGIDATVISPRYLTGIDEELFDSLKKDHKAVVTIEDGLRSGGYGESVSAYYGDSDMRTYSFGYEKEFLDRYDPKAMLEQYGINNNTITKKVLTLLEK
ncbi:MAG TPA: 1-deoxy-D-xylulose-5-phosphate synthase [Eubacterium sp.]|nr:1-deoxy-D-xylulose-5-phosphate synthase [Eubacterium sp.]